MREESEFVTPRPQPPPPTPSCQPATSHQSAATQPSTHSSVDGVVDIWAVVLSSWFQSLLIYTCSYLCLLLICHWPSLVYPPRINQSHLRHLLSHPHADIHLSIYLVTFLFPSPLLHLMYSLNYSPTFNSQVIYTHYIPVTYSCQHSASHIHISIWSTFLQPHISVHKL